MNDLPAVGLRPLTADSALLDALQVLLLPTDPADPPPPAG